MGSLATVSGRSSTKVVLSIPVFRGISGSFFCTSLGHFFAYPPLDCVVPMRILEAPPSSQRNSPCRGTPVPAEPSPKPQKRCSLRVPQRRHFDRKNPDLEMSEAGDFFTVTRVVYSLQTRVRLFPRRTQAHKLFLCRSRRGSS